MSDNSNNSRSPSLRQLISKRWFKVCAALTITLALLFFLFPIGASYFLSKWIMDNGADKVAIEKIKYNFFTNSASVSGLAIHKNGKSVLSESTIFIDLDLLAAFKKEIKIQHLKLADIALDIELYENGDLRIGSYIIKKQEKTKNEVKEIKKALPLIVRAIESRLSNSTIHYKQPDLEVELVIQDAKLIKFNTDPNNKNGSLELKGSLNGAPVSLDLPTLSIAPYLEVKGAVKISDLHLDNLADLLQEYLKPFSGIAAVDGEVHFSMESPGDMRVNYDGTINGDKIDIAGDGWATKGSVSWDGKALYGSAAKTGMIIDVDGLLQGENISFTMPELSLAVHDPAVLIKGSTIVKIHDQVTVDSESVLTLADTGFSLGELKVSNKEAGWQGSVFFGSGTEKTPLQVRVDGTLAVNNGSYAQAIQEMKLSVATKAVNFDGAMDYVQGLGDQQAGTVAVDGDFFTTGLQFNMPDLRLEQQKVAVEGVTMVKTGQEVSVSYDGDIKLNDTDFAMADIKATTADTTWKGKSEVSIGKDLSVNLDGDIGLRKIGFSMADIKAASGGVSWKGKTGYTKKKDTTQLIKLNGALQADTTSVALPGTTMEIRQEQIKSDSNFSLQIAKQLSFSGHAGATADGFTLIADGKPMLELQQASVIKLADNGSGGLTIENIKLNDIQVPSSSEQPYSVHIPQISASGIASPDLTSGAVQEVHITDPVIRDESKKTVLAEMASMSVQGITADKQATVSAQKAVIKKGVFLEQKEGKAQKPMLTLGNMEADTLNWSQADGFSANTIDFDSVFVHFTREKQAKTDTVPTTAEAKPAGGSENADAGKDKFTPPPVKIKQIKVSGNSGFQFTDNSMSTGFTTRLGIKSFKVDNIDLSQPEKPFTFHLKGAFDKHAPLEITGSAAPFADKMLVQQKLHLRNYSLYSVSPYVIDAIGTMFESGQMNLTSELKITGNKLDAKNSVVLKDIKAKTVHNELADELNSKLPVSLDTALSLLRDNHGNIELDVPVTGELTQLNVGLTDIIITAVSTSIITAVTPYLAYTVLGPTGALVYLGLKVGQALLDADLPSLQYEPGETVLTDKQKEQLGSIGDSIKKDVEQDYSICAKVSLNELSGAATTTDDSSKEKRQDIMDQPENRKKLFELGSQRAQVVKDYLVAEFAIDEERLLICSPAPDFDKDGAPTISFKK